MCGFVGFFDKQAECEKKEIVKKMMDRIVHRGPDMEGQYTDTEVALGFRRLSIIDLSLAGTQPMSNENNDIVSVFNGEVYNYQELKKQLLDAGHKFKSQTDSEVVVHGYEEWGKDLLPKLRGMFSFAIWHKAKNKLFFARDPFGIKPFYYARLAGGGLVFGSEIKSFLEHPNFVKAVNPKALKPYLSFQYPAGDETFFDGVYSLPQGHYAEFEHDISIVKYHDMQFDSDESMSFQQAVDKIDDCVHESVKAHCISDVKVGSFLSGGVDSSYITACLMPEKTFSVGFLHNKFDETSYAKELSEKLGIENHTKHISAEECFQAFSDIQYHMDQPQANPSSVPLWFLAKMAKEHVTVVLSGEGADEIFGGYELYVDTPATDKFKKVPKKFRRALGKFAKKLPAMKGRNFLLKSAEWPENWFIGQANVFPEKQAEEILKPLYKKGLSPLKMAEPFYKKVENCPEVIKKQYVDMHLWLPGDILLKADKMCMAHSLELRVPFLDKNVMRLGEKIPPRHNICGVDNKVAFRRAANKTLPDEWANRPKKGFPVPIRHWLREEKYCNIVREYFESEFANKFFEVEKIVELLNRHFEGKANNARKIWVIFTFLVWYKRYFIDETALKEENEVKYGQL